jgi:hypothetical protein
MVYDRYGRGDHAGRREPKDYGRDYDTGRDQGYASARDYDASGGNSRNRDRYQAEDDRDYTRDFVPYGEGGYDSQDYAGRDAPSRNHANRDTNTRDWGSRDHIQRGPSNYGQPSYGRSSYGQFGYAEPSRGSDNYRGSYGSDGRRYENVGRFRDQGDDDRSRGQYQRDGQHPGGDQQQRGNYRGVPQGYDYDDRGFIARAGDEVRSWFGDEDAERRREADMRYDERSYSDRGSQDRDSDYGSWRRSQIAALDRDYDEYRRENRSRFQNEFTSWRTNRQTQRESLNSVTEHMDVVGSDGSHVGTVDKVRGDRILLTKTDKDAEGRHHSIPSSWIASVDTKVTLSKSAEEAKKHWRDEENNSAQLFRHVLIGCTSCRPFPLCGRHWRARAEGPGSLRFRRTRA